MGVLWTVSECGPLTFRDLQEKCETISPAVLNQRIKELRTAGLLQRTGDGYAVTEIGRRVYEHLNPLGALAKEWAALLAKA